MTASNRFLPETIITVILGPLLPLFAIFAGYRLKKNLDRIGVLIAYRTILLAFALLSILGFVFAVSARIRADLDGSGLTYVVVAIVASFLYFVVLLADFFVLALPSCWKHDDDDPQNEEIHHEQKEEAILSASA